jgi:hypothetical protein
MSRYRTPYRIPLALTLTAGAAFVLPVPPTPPAAGPPDRAAPVPTLTFEAPQSDQSDQPGDVRVTPQFFSLGSYGESGGYTPGSQIDEMPGRREPVRAGLSLSIPLQ